MTAIETLVENHGGHASFACALSDAAGQRVHVTMVYNWIKAGHVPVRWLPHILKVIRGQGVEPTADDLVAYCPKSLEPQPKRGRPGSKASDELIAGPAA